MAMCCIVAVVTSRSNEEESKRWGMLALGNQLVKGYMPRQAVLEKYDLIPFWGVAEAVKYIKVAQLSDARKQHEAFFIKCGIYIILKKLKMIAYRNLLQKVYQILQTHQLPVSALLTALQAVGLTDADKDETQCITANLIYDGKIKDYISHQHQKLVVSKQNAFPCLSSVGPSA